MFWTQLLRAQPLQVPERNSQSYYAVAAPRSQRERCNDTVPQSHASDVLGSNEAKAAAMPTGSKSRDQNNYDAVDRTNRESQMLITSHHDRIKHQQDNESELRQNKNRRIPKPERRDLAGVKQQLLCLAGRRAGKPRGHILWTPIDTSVTTTKSAKRRKPSLSTRCPTLLTGLYMS